MFLASIYNLQDQPENKKADRNPLRERERERERERMPGMKIENYGTGGIEEFDYDDEVDYEEDGELNEKMARLEEENQKLKEEYKKMIEEHGDEGELNEKMARLEKQNEKLKEEYKKMMEEKEKLMEAIGEKDKTIARKAEELARVKAENAWFSDLGCFPEGMARKDDEELKRLQDEAARKRSEMGFLPRYPGEKEMMFLRAAKEYVLWKRQESKAKKSGKEMEMPAADKPNLNGWKMFRV